MKNKLRRALNSSLTRAFALLLLIPANIICAQSGSPKQGALDAPGEKQKSFEARQADFNKKSPEELGELLEKDPEQLRIIHRLRVLGNKSSIEYLQHAYSRAKTQNARLASAAALVSLGKRDGEEWASIRDAAEAAIKDSAPYPMGNNGNGGAAQKTYSEEFLSWCKKSGVKPDDVAERVLHAEPQAFTFIGYSADPRAIPILLEGLQSGNLQLSVLAANILARLQYKPAIPLIIDVAKRMPKDMALGLGYSLACFDDPKAQSAVPQLIKDENVVKDLHQRFLDKNCFLLIGE